MCDLEPFSKIRSHVYCHIAIFDEVLVNHHFIAIFVFTYSVSRESEKGQPV